MTSRGAASVKKDKEAVCQSLYTIITAGELKTPNNFFEIFD
jgi:hypothetical protein